MGSRKMDEKGEGIEKSCDLQRKETPSGETMGRLREIPLYDFNARVRKGGVKRGQEGPLQYRGRRT
jgi:hypothetical protein